MVIIEANICGAERIATFQSKAAAFYFLKSITFWASVESIVSTSVRTKIKVDSGAGHLSDWSGALESARDYEENEKEFLFFFNCSELSKEMKTKNDLMYSPSSFGEEVEEECKKRINLALTSSGHRVIDIESFMTWLNRVFLVTVE